MHIKRWITGIIAVPVIAYLVYKGGLYFAALIAAASVLSLIEYFKIVLKFSDESLLNIFPVIGFLAGPALIGAAHF